MEASTEAMSSIFSSQIFFDKLFKGFIFFTICATLYACAGLGKSNNSNYSNVIVIDATDGIDDEEIAIYHDIEPDAEVVNRVVKLYFDPAIDISLLGEIDLSEHNRLKVFKQRIDVYVFRHSILKGAQSFNNVKVAEAIKVVMQETFWK